jgi:hypothetical protein
MTIEAIAEWMHQQLHARAWLYQSRVAQQIRTEWGQEHTYKNKNGNWAINVDILAGFRLTEDTAVWSRSIQAWRLRTTQGRPQPDDQIAHPRC